MASVIPLIADTPNFTQTTLLSGSRYKLTMAWSPRDEAWYADMRHAATGTPIFLGRRLSLSGDLLKGVTEPLSPGGYIAVYGTEEPTLGNLGKQAKLMHFTDEDTE